GSRWRIFLAEPAPLDTTCEPAVTPNAKLFLRGLPKPGRSAQNANHDTDNPMWLQPRSSERYNPYVYKRRTSFSPSRSCRDRLRVFFGQAVLFFLLRA